MSETTLLRYLWSFNAEHNLLWRCSFCLTTELKCVCWSSVGPAMTTIRHVLLLTTCSHMLTADGLFPPPESRRGARVPLTGANTDSGGTVGIPSRQAGCPDSNNSAGGVDALHKVCTLVSVSDAISHLLCTFFYADIAGFLSLWKPSVWTLHGRFHCSGIMIRNSSILEC